MPHSRHERKSYEAEWREKNRLRIRERQRAHYRLHRADYLARSRDYKRRVRERQRMAERAPTLPHARMVLLFSGE